MTTPTLTHDQAALLRSVDAHVVIYIGGPIIGDWDASAYIEEYCGSAPAELTAAGREALAAYDREWVAVRRDDLHTACDALRQSIDGGEKSGHDMWEFINELARLRVALESK